MTTTVKKKSKKVTVSPREMRLERNREALRRVIKSAGSQQALAGSLGVTQAAVSKWLLRGWAPVARAQEMEALFGEPRLNMVEPSLADALVPVAEMESVE